MTEKLNSLDPDRVKRIVVRATNWIGDAVMNTPALGALRATFPDAEITVIANPLVASLFSPHPYCDRVLVFDKKGEHRGVKGFLRFSSNLRREKFDLAVLLQKAFEAGLMAFLAGVPIRLGYATDYRRALLTHRVSFNSAVRCSHHVDHYLQLLTHFGITGGDRKQRLFCTPQEILWAKRTLGDGQWAVINPGAAYGSAKRWAPEKFALVGDRLAEERGLKILLTGGPGEEEIGRDIEQAMSAEALNLIGRTSVREMMSLISCANLMVTNDSGPMHVAAALDIPIVAIFGSTDHLTTHPANALHRIVRKEFDCAPCLLRQCPTDHRCMNAVTVEDVMDAVADIYKVKKVVD